MERSIDAIQVDGSARHWWKMRHGENVMLKLSRAFARVARICDFQMAEWLNASRMCLKAKARPRLGVKGDVKRRRLQARGYRLD
jgi:hypothetical protein